MKSQLFKNAVVGDVIRSTNGKCALALLNRDPETRQQLAATAPEAIHRLLNGKTLRITGNGYVLETVVTRVTVSTSLAGFRNVFVEIAETDATAAIRENDRIAVL